MIFFNQVPSTLHLYTKIFALKDSNIKKFQGILYIEFRFQESFKTPKCLMHFRSELFISCYFCIKNGLNIKSDSL